MTRGSYTTLWNKCWWTFVESFTGFLVADAFIELIGGTVNLPLWQVALGSSLASAVVPVKEFAKRRRDELAQ